MAQAGLRGLRRCRAGRRQAEDAPPAQDRGGEDASLQEAAARPGHPGADHGDMYSETLQAYLEDKGITSTGGSGAGSAIQALITAPSSSDCYESLYKKVKGASPATVLRNYTKYLSHHGKDKEWALC